MPWRLSNRCCYSAPMIKLYGLKNCDSCRKARKWLAANGIDHSFADLREQALDADQIHGWLEQLGAEVLINRRGTTWRQLPESERHDLDQAKALTLVLAHPALIKRPVIEAGGRVSVGFDAELQAHLSGGG